jgi:hypothetical protein
LGFCILIIRAETLQIETPYIFRICFHLRKNAGINEYPLDFPPNVWLFSIEITLQRVNTIPSLLCAGLEKEDGKHSPFKNIGELK